MYVQESFYAYSWLSMHWSSSTKRIDMQLINASYLSNQTTVFQRITTYTAPHLAS